MHGTTAFILTNLVLFVSSTHDVNYCGAKMCGNTDAHTFCQFSPSPSPQCAGYIPAVLSQEEKSRILARLNRRRDDAAAGRLRGLPSAGNMLKLRWVGELAREAQLWADRCRPPKTPEEHDACRDLYSITVGQCVASVVGEAPGLRVESMVDIWFMQNMLYKGNVTLYEPPKPGQRFYGDFAQMMWARAYMVGCGRSRFMVLHRGRLRTVERLVCNFAPQGPNAYRPIWTPGIPATACPPRSRPYAALAALCDYKYELSQPNDIDNSMTMEEHVLLNAVLEIESNKTQYSASLDEIYLTYLAIVTMESSDVTTAGYNSIQKRDIVENIAVEDGNNGIMSDLAEFLNTTINPHTTKTIIIKQSKKKPKRIIGRPKSYNVEELSDVGGNQKEEYHDSTERLSKHKKDFYDEYNLDKTEENATLDVKLEKNVDENGKPVYHADAIVVTNVTRVVSSKQTELFLFESVTDQLIYTTKLQEIIIDTTNTYNGSTAYYINQTSNDITMDDYLSDPETVRQLQEALDHIEREASIANVSKTSGKVRRELRPVPSNQLNENEMTLVPNGPTILPESEVLSTLSPEEQNRTLERGPVLDMVMKYMPYLKNYENGMLGTENSAICTFQSSLGLLITAVLCV